MRSSAHRGAAGPRQQTRLASFSTGAHSENTARPAPLSRSSSPSALLVRLSLIRGRRSPFRVTDCASTGARPPHSAAVSARLSQPRPGCPGQTGDCPQTLGAGDDRFPWSAAAGGSFPRRLRSPTSASISFRPWRYASSSTGSRRSPAGQLAALRPGAGKRRIAIRARFVFRGKR